MRRCRQGTKNSDGGWTLSPGQLSGLTLKAGEVTTANLTVTATNTQGAGASTTQSIARDHGRSLMKPALTARAAFRSKRTVALGIGGRRSTRDVGVGDDCRRTERCDAVGEGTKNGDGSWTLSWSALRS